MVGSNSHRVKQKVQTRFTRLPSVRHDKFTTSARLCSFADISKRSAGANQYVYTLFHASVRVANLLGQLGRTSETSSMSRP